MNYLALGTKSVFLTIGMVGALLLASCEWKAADDFFPDGYDSRGQAANALDVRRDLTRNAATLARDAEQMADWRAASRDMIARIAGALDQSALPVVVLSDQAPSVRAAGFRSAMMEMLMEDGFIVQPSVGEFTDRVQLIYLYVENVGNDRFPDQLMLRARVKRDGEFVAAAANEYTIRFIGDADDHRILP